MYNHEPWIGSHIQPFCGPSSQKVETACSFLPAITKMWHVCVKLILKRLPEWGYTPESGGFEEEAS